LTQKEQTRRNFGERRRVSYHQQGDINIIMTHHKLKPTGHSAFAESLIVPMIVIGSSVLSLVSAYVLSKDFLDKLLAGQGNALDVFLVALAGGLGLMVDTAIIVSATRFKMHSLRGEKDRKWKILSRNVMALGLAVETLTLMYFFYLLAPDSVPPWFGNIIQWVHSLLFFFRSLMPPLIIAYFVAGVLPVVLEREDRDRELKSRTSQSIGVLVERLTDIGDANTPEAMIPLLGSLLELNGYADRSNDTETARDRDLVARLASLHHLPQIGSTFPAAAGLQLIEAAENDILQTPQMFLHAGASSQTQARVRTAGKRRKTPSNSGKRTSVEATARAAYQAGMSANDLMKAAGISKTAAAKWLKVIKAEAQV